MASTEDQARMCYNGGIPIPTEWILSMQQRDWRVRFAREMKMADKARAEGNEGKARVCARRAAGIVADEYMRRRGVSTPNMTAYERVKLLGTWPDLPDGVDAVVAHMTTRVNENYELPIEADLVADVQWLARVLLEDDEGAHRPTPPDVL